MQQLDGISSRRYCCAAYVSGGSVRVCTPCNQRGNSGTYGGLANCGFRFYISWNGQQHGCQKLDVGFCSGRTLECISVSLVFGAYRDNWMARNYPEQSECNLWSCCAQRWTCFGIFRNREEATKEETSKALGHKIKHIVRLVRIAKDRKQVMFFA